MLVQLSIRDIVLIEHLELEFFGGLSVLTGETGAGKSILLDALSLALGARGDGGLVRHGASEGQVTAVFDLPPSHPSLDILAESDLDQEGYLLLKRIQSVDGRSRAFVNDQPVSVALLRELGQTFVELHGQHDERALMHSATHRGLLDAFGGSENETLVVGKHWAEWQEHKRQTAALREQVENSRREADFLRDAVAELEILAPKPGEEEELAARRQVMMKSEKVVADIDEGVSVLAGEASPIPLLSHLAKRLERKSAEVPGVLEEAVRQLDGALNALHLALQELEKALRASEFDPEELENAEERLFALRAASRKYSAPVENLPELAVKLADDLESVNSGEERLETMARRDGELEAAYFEAAERLSSLRSAAAQSLATKVMRELPSLKLEQAEFIVRQESDKENAGENGIDQIEFWVRTNPGTKPGALSKVASGGELSRILLALKVALADKGSAPTLVFDEIDTGVGGAVADAIGRRLARLAGDVQVLSVTHAPQVAARAAQHFVISKAPVDGADEARVATSVTAIGETERREEIARMLAGASITDEARAAAEQLIRQSAA